MKVLYVRSGNSGIDPVSTRQGESLKKTGVDICYYDITGKGLYGYLKNLSPLRKYTRDKGIDLIHAHYSLSGFIASISCSGKPVITSLMGSDVLETNPFVLTVIRFFARFIWDRTIVKTSGMQKKLDMKNTLVIPNGVDMELFFPLDKEESQRSLGWSLDSKHVLFCSDPQRQEKNFALAEKAVAQVRGKIAGTSLTIHLLTGIRPDEIVRYYCAANFLLVTSRHEGSSNTVKEAMACNCPVVASDVGDIRQLLSGTEGCYVTTFDQDDVAVAILKVLNFGRRTDSRARIKHLDSDRIALQILEVYKGLLKT